MTCPVCTLPSAQKVLIERLLREGRSVEEVGASFRIDYDDVAMHKTEHMSRPGTEPVDDVKEMLGELKDMVELARVHAEGEETDAANFAAYGNLVKLYHQVAMDLTDRAMKARAEELKADVLTETLVDRVVNTLLKEVVKIITAELAQLRDSTKHMQGGDAHAQFTETTRRIGSQLQSTAAAYPEIIRSTVSPKAKVKKS